MHIIGAIYGLITSLYYKDEKKVNGIPLAFIIIYLVDKFKFQMNLPLYAYISYLLFLAIIMKVNAIGKIHGAEHMIYNYYTKHKSINENNLEEVKHEKRSVFACRTTRWILILIFMVALQFILSDWLLIYIISYITAREIVFISYKYDKVKTIFSPLYFVSGIIQTVLYTETPRDIHLLMGIKSINRLEELEQ